MKPWQAVYASLDTLSHLRGLLEVTRLVRSPAALPELFDEIARTISEALGFRTVAINLVRPAWDDFEVVTVHGSDSARTQLLGQTTTRESWEPYLDGRFLRGGAYVIPEEQKDWDDPLAHVPDLEPIATADAWRANDSLLVPLVHSDGHVLGIISVDEPESGRRPEDDELAVLVAFAAHVATAIEDAQAASAAAGVRAALGELLELSSRLTEHSSDDSMLDAVARGIQHALAFEKVVVAIADGRGGFAPRGTAGWDAGDPGLDFALTREQLAAVLDPAYEIEGCYLLPRDEALVRVGGAGSSYSSRRNGRGPLAWRRHWLLVPLHSPTGEIAGFVWVDDPEDHLLPSRERLAVLRTFANQAAASHHRALDLDTLRRRNGELAALHGTTIALLDRLDLDSVLEAIVDSAGSLVGTRNAYLYLVDEDADALTLRVRFGIFEDAAGLTMRRGEGLAGRVWESGRSLAVDDYSTWPGRFAADSWPDLRSTLGVPLRAAGVVRGVLGVASEDEERFGPTDVALLERFAQLASLALENAHLYAALAHSEELHRRIVEHSAEIVALLDLDGCVVVASPSTARTFGMAPDELIGTPFTALVHPDDLGDAQQNFARVVGGETSPITVRGVRRDGSAVVLEAIATPVPGLGDAPPQILATARDITGRIADEAERERLEEQLRQAQKMESIGRLAGGIAHDFNNLLTAIRGYAELGLLELDRESAARESLEQIARAAERAASLTSQLLAFSRKQVLRPRVLDLNDVVERTVAMLARMVGEDVLLETSLEPRLGNVRADPTQIEQVLLNLAINARDAMPGGGRLMLQTRRLDVGAGRPAPHSDVAPGSYVTLAVRDTGVGMTPDVAARIFEPFFTTKGVGEGTGLGLATVHGIVSQSGGAVWVESKPGEGSCFTVCLPRV